MPEAMTSHEYILHRLRQISPKESIIYFTGFLEEERLRNPNGSANTIATLAYSLHERGVVHLTQRRLSQPITKFGQIGWVSGTGSGFNYIATGATPKKQPMRWT